MNRPVPARDRLLEAALQEIQAHGQGASVRNIARRAGANQGLIPYYFGDGPGLIAAAVDSAAAVYEHVFETLAETTDSAELARAALLTSVQALKDDPGHFELRRAMFALSGEHPAVRERARALVARTHATTTRLVARARGRSTPDAADAACALALIGAFDGVAALIAVGAPVDLDAFAEALMRMIEGGSR